MAFTEDLTPFFDTVNGFGEAVTYQGSSIKAIFDAAFVELRLGELGVESAKPACLVKTSDAPSAAHGHTVVRGAVTYHVVGVHPDGTGFTVLELEKQ